MGVKIIILKGAKSNPKGTKIIFQSIKTIHSRVKINLVSSKYFRVPKFNSSGAKITPGMPKFLPRTKLYLNEETHSSRFGNFLKFHVSSRSYFLFLFIKILLRLLFFPHILNIISFRSKRYACTSTCTWHVRSAMRMFNVTLYFTHEIWYVKMKIEKSF